MKIKILSAVQGDSGEHLEAGTVAEVSDETAAQLIRQGSACAAPDEEAPADPPAKKK